MKLQDIFEADEPVKRGRGRPPGSKDSKPRGTPAPGAGRPLGSKDTQPRAPGSGRPAGSKDSKPRTPKAAPAVVPPYDENGLSNVRGGAYPYDAGKDHPLHSVRSGTKLHKQYREENKALRQQVSDRIMAAMAPAFAQYGEPATGISSQYGGHHPYGPGCYLEVDKDHKYQLGKGSREIINAMAKATGVTGSHRNFPDIEHQKYVYSFKVDGPNGEKIPAIAELRIEYQEERGALKRGQPNIPERWAVWIPYIYVGEEKSISGEPFDDPLPFGQKR